MLDKTDARHVALNRSFANSAQLSVGALLALGVRSVIPPLKNLLGMLQLGPEL